MELINNTTKTLKDDLSVEIKQGSKVSIAAACFSIYAFQELKEQLSQIEQLRFIFTSPTFVTEKAKKERREFWNETRFSNIFIEKRVSSRLESLERSGLFLFAAFLYLLQNSQNSKLIFLCKVVI